MKISPTSHYTCKKCFRHYSYCVCTARTWSETVVKSVRKAAKRKAKPKAKKPVDTGTIKKCKSYSKYKGLKPPRCGGGAGCDACFRKYILQALERLKTQLEQPVGYAQYMPE